MRLSGKVIHLEAITLPTMVVAGLVCGASPRYVALWVSVLYAERVTCDASNVDLWT